MEGQPGRMEGIGGGDQRLRNQFAVVVRQRARPGDGIVGGGQRHPVEGHQHLAACHVMAFEQAGGSGQRQVQAPCTGVCVHGAGQDIVGLRQPAHHPQHQREIECGRFQPGDMLERLVGRLRTLATLAGVPAGHAQVHPRIDMAGIQLQGMHRVLARRRGILQRDRQGGQVGPAVGMHQAGRDPVAITTHGRGRVARLGRADRLKHTVRVQLRGFRNPDLQLQTRHGSSCADATGYRIPAASRCQRRF